MSALAHPPRPPTPAVLPGEDRSSPYTLVVVRDRAALTEHLAAWEDLASSAIEPNVFYEPWFALPALEAFASEQEVRFVLFYLPVNAQRRQPVLCGLFPLTSEKLHRFVPVRVVQSWQHLYCFLCTPLLRQGHAVEVLDAYFDWLLRDRQGATMWRLDLVSKDGPFGHALTEILHRRQRATFVRESYCRALIQPRTSAEAYLDAALSRKRLREVRRQERHLGERGCLEHRVLERQEDLPSWIDAFLALEASGWKGKEGTALSSREADGRFFRTMVEGAFRRGQLMMLGLFLDGRPIALKCNLLSGQGAFAFKIAFDETFAHSSPGVILEVANIEALHSPGQTRWMDSCAIPGHFMINRLWTERRLIRHELIATGRAPGDLLVSVLPLARWLKRKLRRGQRGAKPSAPSAEE